MSEIKKVENGKVTKYKGVWNATICVEENFTSDNFTEQDLHNFANRCGRFSEEELQKAVEEILSEALGNKVSVSNFNYNFKEV